MHKHWLVLLTVSMCLLGDCSQPERRQIWYGVSDRYGFLLVFDKQGECLILAAIEQSTLQDYRAALASEEIQSDDLGALQSLFGKTGDHYLLGIKENWLDLTQILLAQEGVAFQGVRPSIEAMATMLVRSAGYLRKSPAIDTLGKLVGPHTNVEDVVKALALLEKGVARIRIYDMNQFLPKKGDPKALQRWITDWTGNVLREAMHE